MYIDFLLDAFRARSSEDALVWRERVVPYSWLLDAVLRWKDDLGQDGVTPGSVVSLEADFSPSAVALLLALVEHGCTIVPLASAVEQKKEDAHPWPFAASRVDFDTGPSVNLRPASPPNRYPPSPLQTFECNNLRRLSMVGGKDQKAFLRGLPAHQRL